MKEFTTLAIPKFTLISLIAKDPKLLVPAVPIVGVTKLVVDFEIVGNILLGLFLADLFTGLLASYFIWRKSEHKDRWFFGTGEKGEGFSSDKAKKMGLKALVFLGVPHLCIKLQQALFLKNFKYERISEAEFELATIALIAFCFIEVFSIFCENLPKCGLDIGAYVKKIISGIKCLKKDITDLKN